MLLRDAPSLLDMFNARSRANEDLFDSIGSYGVSILTEDEVKVDLPRRP